MSAPDPHSGGLVAGFAGRLARLHGAHYARMVRRWRLHCATPADAEDLIQEAFTRLYRRYHTGEPIPDDDEVLVRMLHVTARRLLIDEHRATIAVKRQEPDGPTAQPHGIDEPVALDQSVEDEVAMRRLLDHLLDTLDPHWARVLAMLCEDFLPAEIGLVMEGRNGHVLVRQARVHICRILHDLAAAGDPEAAWMGVRFCGWSESVR
jgi:DNA-directed RNA polymerase specialized sigma24 family protein